MPNGKEKASSFDPEVEKISGRMKEEQIRRFLEAGSDKVEDFFSDHPMEDELKEQGISLEDTRKQVKEFIEANPNKLKEWGIDKESKVWGFFYKEEEGKK